MPLRTIEDRITPLLPQLSALNATVLFDCKKDGILFLDATDFPATLHTTAAEADCTITVSVQNLEKFLDGKLDPMMAFTLGKLKVKGQMGKALKLKSLIDS
jgi:putative sterol carrier protein